MSKYQDKWSRWHDKPCVNFEPKSNNGWIYSAYSRKLNLPLDWNKLTECFAGCREGYPLTSIVFDRSPGKKEPPNSRDEILGAYYLGFIHPKYMIFNDWCFSPVPVPPFNPVKTIAALWRLRKAHRNAVWKDAGEPHVWRFAYKIPIQDRAFMLREAKMNVPLFYRLWEWCSLMFSKPSDSSSLINWLKYSDRPDIELFVRYFGHDHDFCKKIRGEL